MGGKDWRGGRVVHHIDGNPNNNDIANLRMVDPKGRPPKPVGSSDDRWDIHNDFGSIWSPKRAEGGFYPTKKTALVACINRMKDARKAINRNIRYHESELEGMS